MDEFNHFFFTPLYNSFFSNELSPGKTSVPTSSDLTVKTDSYSGVLPPCSSTSSLDRHFFERGPSLLIAVSAAFFAEATDILNSLMFSEEESDEEESLSTLLAH